MDWAECKTTPCQPGFPSSLPVPSRRAPADAQAVTGRCHCGSHVRLSRPNAASWQTLVLRRHLPNCFALAVPEPGTGPRVILFVLHKIRLRLQGLLPVPPLHSSIPWSRSQICPAEEEYEAHGPAATSPSPRRDHDHISSGHAAHCCSKDNWRLLIRRCACLQGTKDAWFV